MSNVEYFRNLQRKEQNSRKARYGLSLYIGLARVSVAPVLFVELSNIFNINKVILSLRYFISPFLWIMFQVLEVTVM